MPNTRHGRPRLQHPPRELKPFDEVAPQPGKSHRRIPQVPAADLCIFDPARQDWTLDSDTLEISWALRETLA